MGNILDIFNEIGDSRDLVVFYYCLYKKKRKHYIILNNLSTFEDDHFNLTDFLDWYGLYL